MATDAELLAKYGVQPVASGASSDAAILAKYGIQPTGDAVINEQHPGLSDFDRRRILNLAPTPGAAASELEKLGFLVKPGDGYDIAIKRPGEPAWHMLRETGFSGKRIGDVMGDVSEVATGTAGAVAGSGLGAGWGGAIGGALGSVVPGLGTVAGTAVGSAIGGFAGGALGGGAGIAASRVGRAELGRAAGLLSSPGEETYQGAKHALLVEGPEQEIGGRIIGAAGRALLNPGREAGQILEKTGGALQKPEEGLRRFTGEAAHEAFGRTGDELSVRAQELKMSQSELSDKIAQQLSEARAAREAERGAAATEKEAAQATAKEKALRAAQEAEVAQGETVKSAEFLKEAARERATGKQYMDMAREREAGGAKEEGAQFRDLAKQHYDQAAVWTEKARETRSRKGLSRLAQKGRAVTEAEAALGRTPGQAPPGAAPPPPPRVPPQAPPPAGAPAPEATPPPKPPAKSRADIEREAYSAHAAATQRAFEVNQAAAQERHLANKAAKGGIISWDTAYEIGDEAQTFAYHAGREAHASANKRVVELFEGEGLGREEAVRRAAEIKAQAEVQASLGASPTAVHATAAQTARGEGAPSMGKILDQAINSPEAQALKTKRGQYEADVLAHKKAKLELPPLREGRVAESALLGAIGYLTGGAMGGAAGTIAGAGRPIRRAVTGAASLGRGLQRAGEWLISKSPAEVNSLAQKAPPQVRAVLERAAQAAQKYGPSVGQKILRRAIAIPAVRAWAGSQ